VKHADVVSALVWLAIGLGVVRAGYDLGLGSVRDPGSGFMLFWVGLVMAGLALAILIEALRRPAAGPGAAVPGARHFKVAAVVAALVLYAWLLETLGFILTTTPILIFLFKAVEPQRWSVAIAGGIVSTLTAYLVFRVWLGAQLPVGVLGVG
jgi:putative tricarboxylic transport membrane protein